MILSETEIEDIVKETPDSAVSGAEIRGLLRALPDFEFRRAHTTPLILLCAAGADYGWRQLDTGALDPVIDLPAKAKKSLKGYLRRNLEEVTRPCLSLEWTSFHSALNAIGLATERLQTQAVEQMFLRETPGHRLSLLFKKFPVLAGLWSILICQWRDHVSEVFARLAADRVSLSRVFFTKRIHKIVNAHFGLSDRHNSGRTVVRLEFDIGSIIYKPRSGSGEAEWYSLLARMNKNGFRPKLRPVRVLRRKEYCWMEQVAAAPCRSQAAAGRFYQRMGGIIAAAYLLRAVDCHRENLIASGEDPVLVDVEALWHVPPLSQRETFAEILYQTGFFPDANRRSLQSRSSVLGPGTAGTHVPRLAGNALQAAHYRRELVLGFARAWRAILGTHRARVTFNRQIARIQSTERRWFYWATQRYADVREASIQPQALRSGRERELLIRLQCTRETVSSGVIAEEVRSLRQLDIPYFLARTNQNLQPNQSTVPKELTKVLSAALRAPA